MTTSSDRLAAASEVAAKIADALQDTGYSEVALQWIYDILTSALVGESEYAFSELLEEMGRIYEGEDGVDSDDESDETTTYLN